MWEPAAVKQNIVAVYRLQKYLGRSWQTDKKAGISGSWNEIHVCREDLRLTWSLAVVMNFRISVILFALMTVCVEVDCRRSPRSYGRRSCNCIFCFVCKDCNTVEDMQRVKCETKCFIEEFVNGTVNRGCLDGSPTSECDANLGKYGTKQCCRSDDCNASTNLRVAVSSVASVLLTVKIFQIFLQ